MRRTPFAILAANLSILPAARATAASDTAAPSQAEWPSDDDRGKPVDELLNIGVMDDPAGHEAGVDMESTHRVLALSPGPSAVSLSWPVHGLITSRYGRRGHSRHTGLDIAAPSGTIIVAAAAGIVIRDGDTWGRYGNVVLIEHPGGYSTLYSHLVRGFVKNGDRVERGQAIAAIGQTGNATGPHLHFEIWIGDRTDDPLRYLGENTPKTAEIR